MTSRYAEVYEQWRADPQAFWAEAAKAIDWVKPPSRIFDAEAGVYGRWFPDAEVNACYNALDRQVAAGRGDQAAILYDSPVTGTKRRISYAELLAEVKMLAAVLKDFGVGKGDRVIVYMPMIPEALVGMLACARIGAIHSVVFGGFAAKELATRIEDAEPKLVLTASCGRAQFRRRRSAPVSARRLLCGLRALWRRSRRTRRNGSRRCARRRACRPALPGSSACRR